MLNVVFLIFKRSLYGPVFWPIWVLNVAFFTVGCSRDPIPSPPTQSFKLPQATPLKLLGAWGKEKKTSLDIEVTSELKQKFEKYGKLPNFGNLGLTPIMYLLDNPSLHIIERNIYSHKRYYFVNFGENGFLLARVKNGSEGNFEKKKYLWLEIYTNKHEPKPSIESDFEPNIQAVTEQPQLKLISPMALAEYNPIPEANPACESSGVHHQKEFSLISSAQGNFCLASISNKDSRVTDSDLTAKFVCVSPNQMEIINPNLDKLQFIFRSTFNRNLIFAYEGSYSSPHWTKIFLDTMQLNKINHSLAPLEENKVSIGISPFESKNFGVYLCQNKHVPENESPHSWVYISKNIYLGEIPPQSASTVWIVKETPEGMKMEKTSWASVEKQYSGFGGSSLPPLSCATRKSYDYLCGMKIFKNAISFMKNLEIEAQLSRKYKENIIDKSILALYFLSQIPQKLPNWIFEKETYFLKKKLAKTLTKLSFNKNTLLAANIEFLNRINNEKMPFFKAKDLEDQQEFIKYLGYSPVTWKKFLSDLF